MNAKQAREWIKNAPANPNPKNELAGFGFQCGGDDPESRETAGGPWFLCAECAGRLQARGCGFSSKEAGPIWEGQIHEDCAVCGHSAPTPANPQPRPAAKHTEGPWNFFNSGAGLIRSENGKTIAQLKSVSRQGFRKAADLDEEVANARLIAAAPALLEALRYTVKCLEANRKCTCNKCNAKMDAARAALAKAEGGAQ